MKYRVNRRTGDRISEIGLGSSYTHEAGMDEGVRALAEGAAKFREEGVQPLHDGFIKFRDEGISKLADGIEEFNKEGIQKLTDTFGSDLQQILTRLKALSKADASFDHFAGLAEGCEGSVVFLFETAEIKS